MAISFVVAAVAVYLGFWQYGRHVDRADALANYEAVQQLPPVPVEELVGPGLSGLPDGVEWRMVSATGTFDEGRPTILRTRPIDGTPAWQYLAWLNLDTGQSLLVNLGWVPQPGPNADAEFPELDPHERITVTGIMRVWEPDDGKTGGDTVSRIAIEQLQEPQGDPIPGYLMLREWATAKGPVQQPTGEPVPLPSLTLGPHLAYAWQWWVFAIMAPVGGVLLLRRDARLAASRYEDSDQVGAQASPADQAGTAGTPQSAGEKAKIGAVPPGDVPQRGGPAKPARASALRRRKHELSDEEIEDAL